MDQVALMHLAARRCPAAGGNPRLQAAARMVPQLLPLARRVLGLRLALVGPAAVVDLLTVTLRQAAPQHRPAADGNLRHQLAVAKNPEAAKLRPVAVTLTSVPIQEVALVARPCHQVALGRLAALTQALRAPLHHPVVLRSLLHLQVLTDQTAARVIQAAANRMAAQAPVSVAARPSHCPLPVMSGQHRQQRLAVAIAAALDRQATAQLQEVRMMRAAHHLDAGMVRHQHLTFHLPAVPPAGGVVRVIALTVPISRHQGCGNLVHRQAACRHRLAL